MSRPSMGFSGRSGAGDGGEGGKQIDRHGRFGAGGVGRDAARPSHQGWLTLTTVEGGSFSFSKGTSRASVVTIGEPGTVVRGVDDKRVVIERISLDGVENLADGPVDLHDYVAIHTLFGFARELVGDEQRDVGHAVRDVEEEGFILVLVDEGDRAFGVPGGEVTLVGIGGDYFFILEQRQGWVSTRVRWGAWATCHSSTGGRSTRRSRAGLAGTSGNRPGAICRRSRLHSPEA